MTYARGDVYRYLCDWQGCIGSWGFTNHCITPPTHVTMDDALYLQGGGPSRPWLQLLSSGVAAACYDWAWDRYRWTGFHKH
jgi:hypothetical protein